MDSRYTLTNARVRRGGPTTNASHTETRSNRASCPEIPGATLNLERR